MGVKKYYDDFVSNFMVGSKKQEDDSPSSIEVGLEVVELGETLDTDLTTDTLTDPQESNRNLEEPETTEYSANDSKSQELDPPNPPSEPATSSTGQDDGPEVPGGGDVTLRGRVIAALREVYDPEIPLNIYDLGLIYRLEIDSDHNALIDMTLTSPNCPVAGSLPGEIENAAQAADGIRDVAVELVWDPPWDMDRMGEAAKLELGLL